MGKSETSRRLINLFIAVTLLTVLTGCLAMPYHPIKTIDNGKISLGAGGGIDNRGESAALFARIQGVDDFAWGFEALYNNRPFTGANLMFIGTKSVRLPGKESGALSIDFGAGLLSARLTLGYSNRGYMLNIGGGGAIRTMYDSSGAADAMMLGYVQAAKYFSVSNIGLMPSLIFQERQITENDVTTLTPSVGIILSISLNI